MTINTRLYIMHYIVITLFFTQLFNVLLHSSAVLCIWLSSCLLVTLYSSSPYCWFVVGRRRLSMCTPFLGSGYHLKEGKDKSRGKRGERKQLYMLTMRALHETTGIMYTCTLVLHVLSFHMHVHRCDIVTCMTLSREIKDPVCVMCQHSLEIVTSDLF